MNQSLFGKRVLVMVANGVDETVMSATMRELVKTGASARTVGIEPGLVNSWNGAGWGMYFPVDQQISQTLGADFDYLIVPAGARGIQKLATNAHSERIVSGFLAANKPVALMGDAVELLARIGLAGQENSANVVSGDCASVPAFFERMIAHFTQAMAPVKAAA